MILIISDEMDQPQNLSHDEKHLFLPTSFDHGICPPH
jgi:hypothetical protein